MNETAADIDIDTSMPFPDVADLLRYLLTYKDLFIVEDDYELT